MIPEASPFFVQIQLLKERFRHGRADLDGAVLASSYLDIAIPE